MSNHRRTRRFGVGLVGVWALVLTTGVLVAAEAPDGGASRAEVPLIQVTGVTRVLPIALPDFKDLSELPDTQETGPKLAEILRGDLSASGYFKVIDPKAYLVKPHEEGVTAAAVRFKDWINVGAQVLVKVGLFVREGRLRMEAHLYEVASARPAWKAPIVLKGDLAEGRMMTHRLANAIIRPGTPNAHSGPSGSQRPSAPITPSVGRFAIGVNMMGEVKMAIAEPALIAR